MENIDVCRTHVSEDVRVYYAVLPYLYTQIKGAFT